MIDHCPTMELFSIKQMKVVLIQVVSCCVYDKPKKYSAYAWHHSIHV